jgi:hypothetical protein
MGGLGLGPLIAGLLAQYAPHPTTLVFEVYLAVLAAAGLCLLLVPETVHGLFSALAPTFLGSLATANRLAPPGHRGQAISAYFTACYCGLIIPVVGVGIASGYIGDFRAVLAFSILIAALCLYSLASIMRAIAARVAGR